MWELKYSKRKSAHPPDQARAAGAPPRLCPAWKGMRGARGTFDAGVGVITRCQGRLWSLEFIVHRAESADRCEKGYEKRSVQGLSKCHKTSLKTMKKLQIFKSLFAFCKTSRTVTAARLCSRACRKLLSSETQNTNRNHFKPLIRTFGFASMLFMHAEKTPVSSPTPALGGSALQWTTHHRSLRDSWWQLIYSLKAL